MTGFRSVREFADAYDEGQVHYSSWRKSPTQATSAGTWFDLSMSPGLPTPQYYAAAPLAFSPLSQAGDGGLNHGRDAPDGTSKFLHTLTAMTAVATALPMNMLLCDYLGFYPFVDEGNTDEQVMDNTVAPARWLTDPRVQIMAVSVGARVGSIPFTVNYTNQDGVPGRTTRSVLTNPLAQTGSLVNTSLPVVGALDNGPFLPLQTGDTGVRSIESVTCGLPDVGLFTLVLVKPIAQHSLRGIDAPVESSYLTDYALQAPAIPNDAYLNLLCTPRGTLAATPLHGDITVVWN